MPNTDLEITQKAMEDFIKVQRHMLIARSGNVCQLKERVFVSEKFPECGRSESYGYR